MSAATIRQIHAILSGAFATAVRWEWIDRNPAATAKLPKARQRTATSPDPSDVAKVIAAARASGQDLLALYLWLAAVTGARRGELCALHWGDLDLSRGVIRIAHSYSVAGGTKVRKDTKTHQDRSLAIDEITATVLAERRQAIADQLGQVGVELPLDSYIFSPDHSCHFITVEGRACLGVGQGVLSEPGGCVLFQVHLCASAGVCNYTVHEYPRDPAYFLHPPSADDHRWQPPLIGHACDRHPAYPKKPCCLSQVQQRLVSGGIGRWRRPCTAGGKRASQRPDYRLEYTGKRHQAGPSCLVADRSPSQTF